MAELTIPVHDPVLIVAIAMAGFLVMPLLAKQFRLPSIIGILVAGMIVGPHGTELLERDETIQLLGTVGLLYLVFLAGLEVDLADLSRKRGRAISFGFLTFIVPQVLGTIGGLVFFGYSLPTSILLGSVFSSHSFLALLIAKRLGLTEREMTIAVIGGTVITDTLALLVLAGVAQSARGEFGPLSIPTLLLQAGIYSGIVVFALPIIGRWFFRYVEDGNAQFAFMMTVLFTCGYTAHLAGLEPIIGAFLAGLAINRLVPHHGVLANRAFFIGDAIFVPFFLLSVGMLIDLGMVFGDTKTIEVAIFMTITVVLCKGGAAWLMKVIFGYSRADAVVAWGLSLPQAATTLAVVLVGHELELFDDAILNATIVMVFVTCVLGPMLVEAAGRKIVSASIDTNTDDDGTESHLQRILIPLANPQSSGNLLDLAIMLRRGLNDEPLLPLSVANQESQVAESEKLLSSSVLHLAAAEVPVQPIIRVDPNPVRGILRAQSELRVSSIIVGWAGPETRWQRHFHVNHGIIDDLVAKTTSQLFVVRLAQPPAVINRVIFILPLLGHAELGFVELIADTKMATKRLGAELTIVTDGPAEDNLQKLITATGAKCPVHFVNGHADAGSAIQDLVSSTSLIAMMGCRENSISWNIGWSRQITRLAHNYPQAPMVIAFPRLDNKTTTRAYRRPEDDNILRRADLFVRDELDSVEASIARGVPKAVADPEPVIDSLTKGLSLLHSQVALVHGSAAGVTKPHLCITTFDVDVHHHDMSFRVLITLVNPQGIAASQHLQQLALLAKTLGNPQRLKALLAAETVVAARKALTDPEPPPSAETPEPTP